MAQFNELKTDFKNAKEAFEKGLDTLRSEFETSVAEKNEIMDLSFQMDKQSVDFGVYYCLSETLDQCDRAMKEKPSRELSLVKTKLQEALFWLNES
jgi:hypothetical protein